MSYVASRPPCSSVIPERRGAVNGLGMTSTALFRTLGPSFGGSLFAWSISHDYPFPFNHYFVFFCFALIFLFAFDLARRLPLSLNEPLKAE